MSETAELPPHYRIGIEAMDAQHARWIRLIEKFRAAGADHLRESAGYAAAKEALERLLEYTRLHFASEEKLLAEHHYPGLDAHREEHRKLETAVAALRAELHAHATRTTPLKLNLLATIWLMEHITQADREYARFILAKPRRQAA
jgi:hemerythrin